MAGGGKWNPEMEIRFGLLLSAKVESGRVARGQGTSPSSLMGWGSCCAAVLSTDPGAWRPRGNYFLISLTFNFLSYVRRGGLS